MYLVWWEEDVHDLVVGLAHVVGVQRVHLLEVLPKVDDEPATIFLIWTLVSRDRKA